MKVIRFIALALVGIIAVIVAPYVYEYFHPYIDGGIVRCDGGGKA